MATRFYRWQKNGIWRDLFARLRELSDTKGLIDWDTHCGDSTAIPQEQNITAGKKHGSARSKVAPTESAVRTYIYELIHSADNSRSRWTAGRCATRRSSR
jgi:hypothetical protein